MLTNLLSLFVYPSILSSTLHDPPHPSPPVPLRPPGLLKAGDQGLPWLADSWPSTSLPANGALGSPKSSANYGRGGESGRAGSPV